MAEILETIRTVLDNLEPLGEKTQNWEVDVGPDVPPFLYGLKLRFSKVLLILSVSAKRLWVSPVMSLRTCEPSEEQKLAFEVPFRHSEPPQYLEVYLSGALKKRSKKKEADEEGR